MYNVFCLNKYNVFLKEHPKNLILVLFRFVFLIQFIWSETWLGSEVSTNHSAVLTFMFLILNYEYDSPTQEM